MKLTVRNKEMYIIDEGEGPALVFLHGSPFKGSMWINQLDYFKLSYRVIAPDFRGMGQSQDSKHPFSFEELAEDILALLDNLGIVQFVCCGLSMGGYVAFSLWRKAPERILAFILTNTRPDADTVEGQTKRLHTAGNLLEHGSNQLVEQMLPNLVAADTKKDNQKLVQDIQNMILSMDPAGLAHISLAMAFRESSIQDLSSISVPVLIVAGTEDPITPPDVMQRMADKIPDSQYVQIDKSAHLTPLEQPGWFNKQVKSFLKQMFQ